MEADFFRKEVEEWYKAPHKPSTFPLVLCHLELRESLTTHTQSSQAHGVRKQLGGGPHKGRGLSPLITPAALVWAFAGEVGQPTWAWTQVSGSRALLAANGDPGACPWTRASSRVHIPRDVCVYDRHVKFRTLKVDWRKLPPSSVSVSRVGWSRISTMPPLLHVLVEIRHVFSSLPAAREPRCSSLFPLHLIESLLKYLTSCYYAFSR